VSDEKIGTLPELTSDETAQAISQAGVSFDAFRNTMPRERSRLLRKLFDLCEMHAMDLAKIVTWENGKPLLQAQQEIAYGNSFFEWFSEEAPRVYGDVIPSSYKGNRVITIKQPIGVVGLITPWNFPNGITGYLVRSSCTAMVTRKVGAAIAAGCTVVLKPAADTPYSALALAELSERAGFPKGVFNVVTADKNTKEIGLELCENPVVKKISFTGSVPTCNFTNELTRRQT